MQREPTSSERTLCARLYARTHGLNPKEMEDAPKSALVPQLLAQQDLLEMAISAATKMGEPCDELRHSVNRAVVNADHAIAGAVSSQLYLRKELAELKAMGNTTEAAKKLERILSGIDKQLDNVSTASRKLAELPMTIHRSMMTATDFWHALEDIHRAHAIVQQNGRTTPDRDRERERAADDKK